MVEECAVCGERASERRFLRALPGESIGSCFEHARDIGDAVTVAGLAGELWRARRDRHELIEDVVRREIAEWLGGAA